MPVRDDTIWLTQALIAELFQTSIPNINLHLKAIYAEGELPEAATIKSYLIVRTEGSRQVSREVLHYSLPAILASATECAATVAKNYLREAEIDELNRIVVMFLDLAEDQARRRKQIFLRTWQTRLDDFCG